METLIVFCNLKGCRLGKHISKLHDVTSENSDVKFHHKVGFLMYKNRVGCMVNAGFCDMRQDNKWVISRATDNHGYPTLCH